MGRAKRVFQMIPGLKMWSLFRYGVMHRNSTWTLQICFEQTYRSKKQPNLFFAGQMTGVEGYVESAASGLVAGINATRLSKEKKQLFSLKQLLSEAWPTISPMPTANISNP